MPFWITYTPAAKTEALRIDVYIVEAPDYPAARRLSKNTYDELGRNAPEYQGSYGGDHIGTKLAGVEFPTGPFPDADAALTILEKRLGPLTNPRIKYFVRRRAVAIKVNVYVIQAKTAEEAMQVKLDFNSPDSIGYYQHEEIAPEDFRPISKGYESYEQAHNSPDAWVEDI